MLKEGTADKEKQRETQTETEGETAWGPKHLLRYIMTMLWGEERNKIWRSRLLAWSLHLSPGVSRGEPRMTVGPCGKRGWRGRGEDCNRLGDSVCQLNFYPRGQTANEVCLL